MGGAAFITEAALADDLAGLGIAAGDTVMVHAAMRSGGPLMNGPDGLISALLRVLGPDGTLVGYADWEARYEVLLDADGRVPEEWRAHVPPFDPARSRAARDNGAFVEFLRTTPGALRSGNSGASVVALGAKAEFLTANHPLDYGYGEGSPLARLVELSGKVAMIGAPLDTMTLLHHAEHLADLPDKRVRRVEVPFAAPEGTRWRIVEEFDTARPVVDGLADDVFREIVEEFLMTGAGRQASVGQARAVLVEARPMLAFAVAWLERRVGRP